MAVKFPLKMSDGTLVKTIEELRNHFNFTDVLAYYSNGRLAKWLEDRFYDEEAGKVKALDSKSESLKKDLCSILGIEYLEDEVDKINLNDVLKKNERLERLRVYTADDKILAAVDRVAFTQEELADLLEKEDSSEVNDDDRVIYLCGERFIIPSNIGKVTYKGINNPTVDFDSGTVEAGIDLQDVEFNIGQYIDDDFMKFYGNFGSNPLLGVKILHMAAAKGAALAQFALGNCYYNGKGVGQNYEEAVKWYRKAAEQDNAEAQYVLGHCYLCGHGVEENYEETVKWYQKAAELGNADAQYKLGNWYEFGNIGKQNYEEAVKWYRKAAEKGDSRAQRGLGFCYFFGNGVEQNYKEAIKWFKKGAEQDNEGGISCMCMLGSIFRGGDGVEKDIKQAIKWYQKAAELGSEDAQRALRDIEIQQDLEKSLVEVEWEF